jgi:hypothetical protein
MKTLVEISQNIGYGHCGLTEILVIIVTVALIGLICYFLPDMSKKQ